MRERPSVSSFEPIRLREAVRKLERQLQGMEGQGRMTHFTPPPQVDREQPGILRRWWRALFGA